MLSCVVGPSRVSLPLVELCGWSGTGENWGLNANANANANLRTGQWLVRLFRSHRRTSSSRDCCAPSRFSLASSSSLASILGCFVLFYSAADFDVVVCRFELK